MKNIFDIKPGMTFLINKNIYLMISSEHKKMGRGKAIVKCKIKNILSNSTIIKTFSSNEKFEQAIIDKKEMQFLYLDVDEYFFMDLESYENISLKNIENDNAKYFLVSGRTYILKFYKNLFIEIELPNKVKLEVIEADDIVSKGNTTNNPTKIVKLQTGLKIKVPLFIKNGDSVYVSTDPIEYFSKS